MNYNQEVLEQIQGAIASLTDDQQKQVRDIAATIRCAINISEFGRIALALVGAEFAVED